MHLRFHQIPRFVKRKCVYDTNAKISLHTYGDPRDRFIDEPVMRAGVGDLRYYHRTQQYSITALTDSSGNVTERYAYTAYGTPTITGSAGAKLASSADNNRYTYTGREWDQELGLYHYRARMYDATSGRFCSRDPIGFVDGPSLYASYFTVSRSDPRGLCDCCCCPKSLAYSGIKVGPIRNPIDPNIVDRLKLVFRVNATLDLIEDRYPGGSSCGIEWRECTSTGGSLGQKPGEWFRTNSPTGVPPENAFSDWTDPIGAACPGSFTRYWEDTPSINLGNGNQVEINFAVRITQGEGCRCEDFEKKSKIEIFFHLDVRIKKANNLFPMKTEFIPSPPKLQPGLANMKGCSKEDLEW